MNPEIKIKATDLLINETFDFNNDDNSNLLPTQEELETNKNFLYGDNSDLQSMSINFFSQALSFVNKDIYDQIINLSQTRDPDIYESIIDFLCSAIRSQNFPLEILINSHIEQLLLNMLKESETIELKKLSLYAIFLFSKRSPDLAKFFFEQGVIQICCEFIHGMINSKINIPLMSECLRYMNFMFRTVKSDGCNALSPFLIPIYHDLLELQNAPSTLMALILNSLRFFIMYISDQILHQLLNEKVVQSFFSLITSSEENALLMVNLFIAISYHSFEFSIQLLPAIQEIIKITSDVNFNPRNKNEMRLAICATLRNLAAENNKTILEFLNSQLILSYLYDSICNQPYSIVKQALFVLVYLSIATPDSLLQICSNDKKIILYMLEMLDENDYEFTLNFFECINNILDSLEKQNESSYVEFIHLIQESGIEETITTVLEIYDDHPELMSYVEHVNDALLSI